MMKVYETVPDFIKQYGDDDGLSTRLTKVYNNIQKTGGPFHKALTYQNFKNIPVPDIKADMQALKIDVLGFYRLRRIQVDITSPSYFCDIDILLVGAEHWTQEFQTKAARTLKKVEEDAENIKCCMEYKGDDEGKIQLNDYLYGYVRLIQRRDITLNYADWIYEG